MDARSVQYEKLFLMVSERFSIFNKLKRKINGIIDSVKSVDNPLVHWYLLNGNDFDL